MNRLREKEQDLEREVAREKRTCKKLEQAILEEKQEAEKQLNEDRRSAKEARRQLQQCDKRLKHNDKYAKVLEINNEVLLQKAEFAKRERDLLKESFTRGIVDMQKKSNMHR